MNRQHSRHHRLRLEPLEDRCLLSAGFLDSTFAGDGMVATNVGLTNWREQAWDVAVYPGSSPGDDGKILAVGIASTRLDANGSPDLDWALVRYNPDGTLDAGFGQGGKVTTSMGTVNDFAVSVALLGSKILVGGFTDSGKATGFALARYNDNGSLDTTFGVNGTVFTSVSQGSVALAMKVDSRGRIVMAGTDAKSQLVVARFTSNGSLDTKFGKRGIVTTSVPLGVAGHANAMDLAVTPVSAGAALADSIVVVAPPARVSGTVTVARYTAAGALDTTFDGDGLLALPASSDDPTVAIDGDGRLVVATQAPDGISDIQIVRLNTNGTFDTSFDGDGIATTNRPEVLHPTSVALQADGKIVVAGRQIILPGGNFFVARYTPTGALDTTFGSNGVGFSTDGTEGSVGEGATIELALQGNGKIVAVGESDTFGPTGSTLTMDFALARFQGDAALKAAAPAPNPVFQTLSFPALAPLVDQAFARWQAAGVDTSRLHGIDVRIADLGGTTLGLASGHTIWLDDNAAGWGWFVDQTPGDDAEFLTPGSQGEQHRIDLLTVLEHEVGHLLGFAHTNGGVMAETLLPGARLHPTGGLGGSSSVVAADALFALLAAEDDAPWNASRLSRRGPKQ
jgi:uncharacterized delta-60 repeat protein